MQNRKIIFSLLKRIIYFVLPIVLLYFIFIRIDFEELFAILKKANPLYVLLGIGLKPLMIVLGSIRWHLIGNYYSRVGLLYPYTAYHYWAGLAIGYFTPGNVGWDAYRVITIGRKIKAYSSPIITIIAEKLIGLISVLTMVFLMFPFAKNNIVENRELYTQAYNIGLLVILSSIFVFILINKKQANAAYNQVIRFINKLILSFSQKFKLNNTFEKFNNDLSQSKNLLSIYKAPTVILSSFFLSLALLVVSAICSQLIFMGLGIEISLAINLFAAPIFFILFIIPISFGSIGVREGAFILIYGIFGITMEIALLVSFLNLLGLMLNNIIGAGIIFSKGISTPKSE